MNRIPISKILTQFICDLIWIQLINSFCHPTRHMSLDMCVLWTNVYPVENIETDFESQQTKNLFWKNELGRNFIFLPKSFHEKLTLNLGACYVTLSASNIANGSLPQVLVLMQPRQGSCWYKVKMPRLLFVAASAT